MGVGQQPPEEWTAERRSNERYAESLVGLEEAVAVASAKERGLKVKVYRPEEVARSYELSFDPSRVNLTVVDGLVTEAAVH